MNPADSSRLPGVPELATCAGELLRQAQRELARLRATRGAYKRTARRIARVGAQLALAASLLGAPLAATAWAKAGPCFRHPSFGVGNVVSEASPEMADIDGDGDLDAFVGSLRRITFFRNTGTATAPAFAAPQGDFFSAEFASATAPKLVDIDGDDDLDAFIGQQQFSGIIFFRNTGTAAAPAFGAPQTNPFGLVGAGWGLELVDINGDGDLDVFTGEEGGRTIFFRNTGTAATPAFAAPQTNPFGLVKVFAESAPEFVDIDRDGDLDALIGEEFGRTIFFRNTGTAAAPAFAAPQTGPFGLADVGFYAQPELADIDGDGDLDAFIGEEHGNTIFFRNTGTGVAPAFAVPLTRSFGLADVGQGASPELVDVDGDGDLDGFVGTKHGDTIFFRNTGTAAAPGFAASQINPFGLDYVIGNASPELVDINGDGDLEAFVGDDLGDTSFFRNTGSVTSPAFATPQTNPFGLLNRGFAASPDLVDIDRDGDLDAFLGFHPSTLIFSRNTGTAAAPAFAAPQTNPFGLVAISGDSPAPELVDIDGDDDLDAFIGSRYGAIVFYRNTGSAVAPAFAAFAASQVNPFGLADVGYSAEPELVDIDGDGDLDAFVGEYYGNTVFFENDCVGRTEIAVDFGATAGLWTLDGTEWRKIHDASPEGMVRADMDGSGVDELVVDFGAAYGVWVLRNNVAWQSLHGASPEHMISADMDGNGKEEVIFDFGGSGVWARRNDLTWLKLHATSPEDMVSADMDANGKEEVLFDFGSSYGIWVLRNETAWQQLHPASPELMVRARLDRNGKDEIVIDFGASGVWMHRNDATWQPLRASSPEGMVSADMNANGTDEILFDFGPSYGVWVRRNDIFWEQLHTASPEEMVRADPDDTGKEDVILDFGPGYGIWIRRSDAAWEQLHAVSPDQIVAAQLDGD